MKSGTPDGRDFGHREGTGATGLEPATSGVTGRRSNQLSYAPVRRFRSVAANGADDARRTLSGTSPRRRCCDGRTSRPAMASIPRRRGAGRSPGPPRWRASPAASLYRRAPTRTASGAEPSPVLRKSPAHCATNRRRPAADAPARRERAVRRGADRLVLPAGRARRQHADRHALVAARRRQAAGDGDRRRAAHAPARVERQPCSRARRRRRVRENSRPDSPPST